MSKKAKGKVKGPSTSLGATSWIERKRIQYVIIIVLVLVQYAQTTSFDYALDDTIVITKNSKVQKGWKDIPSLFSNRYTGRTEDRTGYRPITLLSFATDVQFFGLKPGPSHVMNVILYALACILLLKVLNRLFPVKQWLIFWVVVLFTVHPLHTEVVANIKSRDEILAMIFGLLFIRFHLRYFESGKIKFLLLAPLFYLLAVLSKESALTFVGISTAIGLFSSEYAWKNRLLSISSTVFAIAVIIGIRLFIFSEEFYEDKSEELKLMGVYNFDGFVGNPMVDIKSGVIILANSFNILFQSVKTFFIPHPLVHDYSFNHFPVILSFLNSPRVWGGFVLLVLLVALSLYGFKRKSMVTVGAAWFLVSISIYLSIVVPATDIFAERFLFFPSIGLALMVFGILDNLLPFDNKKRNLLGTCLTLPLLVLSIQRTPAWESSYTLLDNDVDLLESSVRANYNWALKLHQNYDNFPEERRRGDEERILKYYNRALKQTDRLDNLFLALGNAYMRFGMKEKGLSTFLAYSEAHPYLAKPFTQLGNYYATSNQLDSAVHYFGKAVEIGSINAVNYLNLGLAHYNNGQVEEAIDVLSIGEPYAKTNYSYYRKFTGVCLRAGEYQLAEEIMDKGLFLFPQDETLLDYKAQFEHKKRRPRNNR